MTATEKPTVLAGLKGRGTALTWASNKCMYVDIIKIIKHRTFTVNTESHALLILFGNGAIITEW